MGLSIRIASRQDLDALAFLVARAPRPIVNGGSKLTNNVAEDHTRRLRANNADTLKFSVLEASNP